MTRRILILAALAASLRADNASDAWDRLAAAAGALSQGDAVYFLSMFDRKSPGYETLRSNVSTLLSAAQVQSSIDLVNNDGDDARRTIEVDWLLRLVPRGQGASPVQRQQKVKCVLEKRGRKWQIESLDPVQFLAWP